MKWQGFVVIIYGVILLIGGLMGYIKAHSYPSLIMGGGFAILTLLSGYSMFKGNRWGATFALVIACILTLFFAYRFVNSWNFMPPGLMALLSLIVAGTLFKK